MQVTLGGDRLGSGNKNKIALNNYNMSTHNLSQKWTSSMQVGTLYPFLVIPAMRGDKFTINLKADARTIPTKGPLFGSYKVQYDVFECPVRLYQAILHNNPLNIGLKMSQVKFPLLDVNDGKTTNAFSNSSLLKYLGVSGIGHNVTTNVYSRRYFNAIPALAYYEIFKTYYSNKQEENAYTISTITKYGGTSQFEFNVTDATGQHNTINTEEIINYAIPIKFTVDFNGQTHTTNEWQKNLKLYFEDENGDAISSITLYDAIHNIKVNNEYVVKQIDEKNYVIQYVPYGALNPLEHPYQSLTFTVPSDTAGGYIERYRGLQPFPLANIDEMRLKLLSHHTLGQAFKITSSNTDDAGVWDNASGKSGSEGLPYTNLINLQDNMPETDLETMNVNPLNGLVVKTYQSDLYNNWVNTEWIDGENGIAAVTAISTATGSIKIDTINLAEKLYNMLNRIAVSDGSYEGWQDAVYTDTPKKHIESPIYLGGMSSEIMFEEIVQNSQGSEDNPLGTLAGKGKMFKRKSGRVTVKCSEACFIIGIVSITPRINYCQGNEFYMTDLFSMDDFHKPALDGIGFQNLIAERLAWWDTTVAGSSISNRHTIGKLPAWIEYMTAVDKCYGDFAETEGKGFMTLLRDYTRSDTNTIQDATTYIDPAKFNYAFAVANIDSQNFWVQIQSDITARRLMSAKQIPNL